jgi:hypothetical protein
MLRVLALELLLVASSLTVSPAPAVAAYDCKYDAMCPSVYACKTNAVQCAASPLKGTCTRIVSDVGRRKPALSNPGRSSEDQGASGGMTAQ